MTLLAALALNWGNAAAQPADALPTTVPAGTTLVVADDARGAEQILLHSGEGAKLAAKVSFASFSSGPLRMEALRSGAAQVALVGDVPPILTQATHDDMLIVGVIASDGPRLLLSSSPQSGITQLSDLKGKRVGINEGTAQHAVVLRNLDALGLKASDIVAVPLGIAEFADALRANQIDAAVLKQPDRARYLRSVSKTPAVELDNAPSARGSYLYAYATKNALQNPAQAAAIRDFVIHWYRAHEWKNNHPEAWKTHYLVANQRLRPEDADTVLASDGVTTFPGLSPQQIATQQKTIDLLQQGGSFRGKTLVAEKEFDLRFADLTPASATAH